MLKRKCKECGNPFLTYPCIIKNGRGKFCSKKCASEWASKNIRGENCPTWKGGKTKRICEICGTVFPVYPSEIKKGHGKFCSRACHGKWKSQNHRGTNNPNWQDGRKKIKRICEACGTEFLVQPSKKVKKGRGKFCSPECKGEWHSKHLKGENSPSWKNGASFEPYCAKFNEAFKEYVRDKFERICFLCGKTEEENCKTPFSPPREREQSVWLRWR